MSRLYRLILIFAVLFTVLLMAPAFVNGPFGPYPLMTVGEVLDLLTPLILIPIYWLLLELTPEKPPSRSENLLFLVLAVLWADGHGMHLAANSIGHLLKDLAGSDVYTLTDFYDEVLSHYLWHFAVVDAQRSESGYLKKLWFEYWAAINQAKIRGKCLDATQHIFSVDVGHKMDAVRQSLHILHQFYLPTWLGQK